MFSSFKNLNIKFWCTNHKFTEINVRHSIYIRHFRPFCFRLRPDLTDTFTSESTETWEVILPLPVYSCRSLSKTLLNISKQIFYKNLQLCLSMQKIKISNLSIYLFIRTLKYMYLWVSYIINKWILVRILENVFKKIINYSDETKRKSTISREYSKWHSLITCNWLAGHGNKP